MQKPLTEPVPSEDVDSARLNVAGELNDSPLVELLAYAFNQRFTGVLALQAPGAEKLGVGFEAGRVNAVRAPALNDACQARALEAHLPPETIGFAQDHARLQRCDLLSAVEALQLLPTETRRLVRAEGITEQLVALCRLRQDSSFAFIPGAACDGGTRLERSLDPLALITTCILAEPAIERARRSVDAFRDDALSLVPTHAIDPAELRGVSRGCLRRLAERPYTFSELRRVQPGTDDETVAFVYALFLTGQVALRTGPSERPRPMHHSHVPRHNSSHGMRVPMVEHLGPTAPRRRRQPNTRPRTAPKQEPRSTMHPPPAGHRPLSRAEMLDAKTRAQQEAQAEAKVANAWMMGEADHTFLEKARVFTGKVVQLFPENPRIRYCFACLQRRAGRTDAAIREFARVLEVDPGHVDAKSDLDQLLKLQKQKRRES